MPTTNNGQPQPLKDAAKARGWNYDALRYAVLTGDLPAIRIGRTMGVTDEILAAWEKKVKARGGVLVYDGPQPKDEQERTPAPAKPRPRRKQPSKSAR